MEKVYTSARKQMLISSLPPVITLHLKRFHQVGSHNSVFFSKIISKFESLIVDWCVYVCDFVGFFLSFKAGMNLRKVNRHVDFPLILDLAPFCSASCKVLQFKFSENFPAPSNFFCDYITLLVQLVMKVLGWW